MKYKNKKPWETSSQSPHSLGIAERKHTFVSKIEQTWASSLPSANHEERLPNQRYSNFSTQTLRPLSRLCTENWHGFCDQSHGNLTSVLPFFWLSGFGETLNFSNSFFLFSRNNSFCLVDLNES